jgi:hypothetical protein
MFCHSTRKVEAERKLVRGDDGKFSRLMEAESVALYQPGKSGCGNPTMQLQGTKFSVK